MSPEALRIINEIKELERKKEWLTRQILLIDIEISEKKQGLRPYIVDSPHFRRGQRDGQNGRPPSDLSREYMIGYEEGRKEYLANEELAKQLQPDPDDPDFA